MKGVAYSVIALFVVLAAATWFMSRPLFDEQLTADILNEVQIAPVQDALTFARTANGEVFLVVAASAETITGISLAGYSDPPFTDAIDAFLTLGRQTLLDISHDGSPQSVPWPDLGIPIEEHYPHIAAGTNYQDHAEEVGHEGDPFLFPKLSHVTAWNADVVEAARLDYEVEICAVPLGEHSEQRPATLAYLLCGDYTDRWSLVKNIDTGGVMGQTGFPIAKGGPTRLPVGALLVIPQHADFYESMDISLYVNDVLRQQSSASLMRWSPMEILSRALADCESPYYTANTVVRIGDCDAIPARTVILTGTPGGVMFKLATLWSPLAYLRSGDVVIARGKYLGYTRNEIVSR